jgi:hypothetical protein
MSKAAPEDARSLEDYVSFLSFLGDGAISYAVIGGCAVGAYARLRGLTVFSKDLDVYTTGALLNEMLALLRRNGIAVRKVPRPRSVPVATFEWEGKEVNVVTSSSGLPDPSRVSANAREFKLSKARGLSVPVADPFDLLANKLAVNRPKDRPHIDVLKSFLHEEIVETFKGGSHPRLRFLPAQRFLDVTGASRLPEPLFARLVPLATHSTDFRFLAARAPTTAMANRLLHRAPKKWVEELRRICNHRRP